MSTLIIAEIGVNHNGNLDLALELIQKASESGADIVKFQTYNASSLVTSSAPLADYQSKNLSQQVSQHDMLSNLVLPISAYPSLISACSDYSIEFLSSAFDIESLDFISSLNLNRLKVPSGEITNVPYLRHIASLRLPIILSTGMATISEIGFAIDLLLDSGILRDDITVLHCTTEYPAPLSEVNLSAMPNLANAFGVKYGYSDHTLGVSTAIAAVALGATVIEKHITLDKSLEGPDHKASLLPDEFSHMVSSIRDVESSIGDGFKRPTSRELIIGRLSEVNRCISVYPQGDTFSVDNLTTKRPGTGLSPVHWDTLLELLPCGISTRQPI